MLIRVPLFIMSVSANFGQLVFVVHVTVDNITIITNNVKLENFTRIQANFQLLY